MIFIYRDEYYNPESDQRGLAEIIVAKHRNGPTGVDAPRVPRPVHEVRRTSRASRAPSSASVGRQNSLRSGSTSPRSCARSISTHATPLLSRVHAGLGLDLLGDEHAGGRGELRIAVEALLVAQELVDAGDLADALHLDDDRAPVAVAAQQVDRADVGRELAAHEHEVVAQRGDAGREQLLQLGLDAVLLEPGVVAELDSRVVQHLVQLISQRLALRDSSRRSCRRAATIVHGGLIQLSGLYAFASEWIAIEPSAFNSTRRTPGARRAPSRPS